MGTLRCECNGNWKMKMDFNVKNKISSEQNQFGFVMTHDCAMRIYCLENIFSNDDSTCEYFEAIMPQMFASCYALICLIMTVVGL